MRITGGQHKGRIIHPPKNNRARPTTDIAKEGLFNILSNHFNLPSCRVLDLFAGTGGISYEFASRGCKQIYTVEQNGKLFALIKQTKAQLDLSQIKPIKTDVFQFIKSCTESFDIIFADPPYQLKQLNHIPQIIFHYSLLKPNGWLILEHPEDYNFNNTAYFVREKHYGTVHFSIFEAPPYQ